MNAEINIGGLPSACGSAASMGPGSDERGNAALATVWQQRNKGTICARCRNAVPTTAQRVFQLDHNYLLAKEFAGSPQVAHHVTARRAVDEMSYDQLSVGYR